MSIKGISRIKDEDNLFRDMNSNAILFSQNDDASRRRSAFFKSQTEDINKLKEEVSEIKDTMSKILQILSKGKTE